MQSAQVCKRGVYVCDRVVRESVVGESACVCVCVKHLNRCKTSNSCFGFFSNCVNFKAGGRGDLQSSAQRSSLQASQEARTDHPCVPARL